MFLFFWGVGGVGGFVSGVRLRQRRRSIFGKMSDITVNDQLEGIISDFEGLYLYSN